MIKRREIQKFKTPAHRREYLSLLSVFSYEIGRNESLEIEYAKRLKCAYEPTIRIRCDFGCYAHSTIPNLTLRIPRDSIDIEGMFADIIITSYFKPRGIHGVLPSHENLPGNSVRIWDTCRGGWNIFSIAKLLEDIVPKVIDMVCPDNVDEPHDDSVLEYVRRVQVHDCEGDVGESLLVKRLRLLYQSVV